MRRHAFASVSVFLICLSTPAIYAELDVLTYTYTVTRLSMVADQTEDNLVIPPGQCQNLTKSFTFDSAIASRITKLSLEVMIPSFMDFELLVATKSGNTFHHEYKICVQSGAPAPCGTYGVEMTFIFLDGSDTEVVRGTHTESISTCSEGPTAPTSLSATAVSTSQINLNWQDNSSNESGFKIERSLSSSSGFSQISIVGVNATVYSNTGLSPSTTYHYRVRAYNSAGNSSYSNTTSVTTDANGDSDGESIVCPQLALGGGYEAVLFLSNATTTSWNGLVMLSQGNEQEWSSPWALNGIDRTGSSSFDVYLNADATQKFVLTSNAGVEVGYLQILGQNGDQITDIAPSFFYNVVANGHLVDSIGAPSSVPGRRFLCPVEQTQGVDTGFAWAPASALSGFPINLTLYDSNGNLIRSQTVTFNGHLAQFFHEAFDNFPGSFVGKVLIESQEDIHLTVLRLNWTQSGFQLTSVPPTSEEVEK